jgi:hypothetical protein
VILTPVAPFNTLVVDLFFATNSEDKDELLVIKDLVDDAPASGQPEAINARFALEFPGAWRAGARCQCLDEDFRLGAYMTWQRPDLL